MNEDVCYVELMTDLKSYAEKLGYKFEGGSMIKQEFTIAGYGPKNKFKIIPLRFTHDEKEIKYRYDIPQHKRQAILLPTTRNYHMQLLVL